MKNRMVTALTMVFVFLFALPAKADTDEFSNEELQNFADAVVEVMAIQQQGQAEMIGIIEEEDMTVQRFNEINMQAQQLPLEDIEADEAEMEVFLDLLEKIESIQVELEEVLIEAIEEKDITLERYEEIMTAYQQSPELQQRIQQMLQVEQEEEE